MTIRIRSFSTRRILAILTVAIGALATNDAMAGSSSIAVEHAWARATFRGAMTGAAYLTLINSGATDDRLLSVSSPVAKIIQFHSEINDSGVMKMDQLPTLLVRPGIPVVLKPGGIHMMMLGLNQQLKEGQTFPLTLSFEQAGVIEVTVRIGKAGAMDDTSPQTKSGG